jgi:hypothetical protein
MPIIGTESRSKQSGTSQLDVSSCGTRVLLRHPYAGVWFRPADEKRRLAAWHQPGLLDTPPEERFDRLTRLAAVLFDVPIVLVSLVDHERQWCKSPYGIAEKPFPREMSLCAHASLSTEEHHRGNEVMEEEGESTS